MQVTIKSVDVEWVPGKNGKYGKATVKFDQAGKERTQYLVSFKNPDVFKKVQEMVGQTVEVEQVKNGDFWEWKSIQSATATAVAGATSGATATRVSGSNYETKEERAARQVLIVKQSSLSAAVETLTPGAKAALDPDAVVALAQRYTDWVFSIPPKDQSIEGMSDDIPF